MFQLEINTPFGTIMSSNYSEETMTELMDTLDVATQISMSVENGSRMYMTKEMIGQCVFFVHSVQPS